MQSSQAARAQSQMTRDDEVKMPNPLRRGCCFTGADSNPVGISPSDVYFLRFRPEGPTNPMPVCVSHRKEEDLSSSRPEGPTQRSFQANSVVSAFHAFSNSHQHSGTFDPGRGCFGPAGPEPQNGVYHRFYLSPWPKAHDHGSQQTVNPPVLRSVPYRSA